MATITIPELYHIYLQYPHIQTDSRKVQPGDLYFALKGPNFDGNTFAADTLQKGAAYAIIDDEKFAVSDKTILVEDVLHTLQQLARHHRQQLHIPIIAITGSNGKTTTKELIAHTLSAQFKTYATEGNLNNHIGVPLTLLKIKEDAEIAIIEMGANHQKEIAAYCTIALPDYGLITNIGKAHLEGFGGIEGVRKAKGELYDFIRDHGGSIFRFTDLDYLATMSIGIDKQITYGTHDAAITGNTAGKGFFLDTVITIAGTDTNIQTHLVGNYNLPNVLAAFAVAHHFGMDTATIKGAVESYVPSNSRSQLITKDSNQIISDAYNANPSSMKLALENIAQLPSQNKWVLLGAMKEMGENSDTEHQALADLAVALGLEHVVIVGDEFKNVKHPFLWFATSEDAAVYIKAHPVRDALILVKGSRGSHMEKVLEAL